MDHLWSPWRYKFLTEHAPKEGCVFCRIAARPEEDQKNFVVHRANQNFVLLNLYPYTTGHLMIVPYEHIAELSTASDETISEMIRITRFAEKAIRELYRPDGLNLGMNIGASAGAGIAGHIHMHILPRWTGDANFMSTIGETRLLAEELPVTWGRFKAAFTTFAP